MLSSFNDGDVFRLSVSLMNSQTRTTFCFRPYTFSVGFCVFIPFSCSWVTKYLECESLCSSCTRSEIIAMIIKKNMTKLYMHQCRWSSVLLYCHPWEFLLLLMETISQKSALFCASRIVCAFVFSFPLKFLQACAHNVTFQWFLASPLCTLPRCEYWTQLHKCNHRERLCSSELVID